MNMWFAIFAIVAVVMIADTVQKVAKAKAQKKSGDAELNTMLARIDELEERVRVLERIVTEDKRDLRREINRL
ncbi:hypothetical protein GWP57_00840 [Gammaproteobacteria bacterium]|jgi:cell division protein FtsB|nr:hypothetical protein [Gammaproteobacteria bacterium]